VPLGPSPPPPLSLPRTERVRGVDVSTPAPWRTIREAGFAFAFAAATHGLTRNASFPANWSMMKRCGLPRGAYHFLTEKADGASQARAFLAQIEGDPGELPPVVDLEDPRCKGECCALSCGEWTRIATGFVEAVTAGLSRAPIVYVVEPFFIQCLCGTFKLKAHPLWLAGWPRFDFPEKVRTGGFGRWTFYQHTGNTRIGGGVVDLDLFRGNAGDLERFIATDALPE
jgi:lysozyme